MWEMSVKAKSKKVAKTVPSAKPEKKSRLGLADTGREMVREQKGLLAAMIGLMAMSLILLVIALVTLRPQETVVITGYGDVYGEFAGLTGGYRRASWLNMLAFPILALLFGVVHNFIAVRVYQKYGRDAALGWIVVTMLLVVATAVVMFRLLGEG